MKYYGLKFEAKKQDENTAVIDIDGDIGVSIDWAEWKVLTENTNKGFKKKLEELGEVKNITVNINSLGGDVNDGISIHDQLKDHKAKITVNIKGFTASAATIIAMAGDQINMSDNALFLIHRASTGIWGNKFEIENTLQNLIAVDENIMSIYEKRTGQDRKVIEDLMNEGNGAGIWLNAKKAKEKGFVDEIKEPSAKNAFTHVFMNSAIPPLPEEIENLINDNMKIKLENFPLIGKLFAKNSEPEQEITMEDLTIIENKQAELEAKNSALETDLAAKTGTIQELTNSIASKEAENTAKITEMQNKISALETENKDLKDKANGGITQVEKKEDPAIEDAHSIKTKNQIAAEENAKSIKGDD